MTETHIFAVDEFYWEDRPLCSDESLMSKIQSEYDLVERAFCEQLKAIGWQWD